MYTWTDGHTYILTHTFPYLLLFTTMPWMAFNKKRRRCVNVFRITCKNCEKVYIGETGRSLGKSRRAPERSESGIRRRERTQSVTEMNKLTITDHTVQENHVTD